MNIIYTIWQCTWGILQTLVGLAVFLLNFKCRHFFYHGAVITVWKGVSSVSLGMFVFITDKPFFYDSLKDTYTKEEMWHGLLVHEYGHTIQSLILGPLYLIVMGIPSAAWASLPCAVKKRREQHVSYFSFFTERWANYLGEKVTNERSLGQAVI